MKSFMLHADPCCLDETVFCLQVWCNTQAFKNKRKAPASLYIQDVKTNKTSVSTAMSVSYITLFAELKYM